MTYNVLNFNFFVNKYISRTEIFVAEQCDTLNSSSSKHRIFSRSSFEKLLNKLELFHSSSMYRWANNDRMPVARRARQYRGIVVDLRLFRMRSDRDAINNDALTDPMAGGRPHESHDLTFAWVACPRPIARARVSPRESIAMRFLRASAREKRESNFKCNDYRHHRCADLARELRTFAFSPHSSPLISPS